MSAANNNLARHSSAATTGETDLDASPPLSEIGIEEPESPREQRTSEFLEEYGLNIIGSEDAPRDHYRMPLADVYSDESSPENHADADISENIRDSHSPVSDHFRMPLADLVPGDTQGSVSHPDLLRPVYVLKDTDQGENVIPLPHDHYRIPHADRYVEDVSKEKSQKLPSSKSPKPQKTYESVAPKRESYRMPLADPLPDDNGDNNLDIPTEIEKHKPSQLQKDVSILSAKDVTILSADRPLAAHRQTSLQLSPKRHVPAQRQKSAEETMYSRKTPEHVPPPEKVRLVQRHRDDISDYATTRKQRDVTPAELQRMSGSQTLPHKASGPSYMERDIGPNVVVVPKTRQAQITGSPEKVLLTLSQIDQAADYGRIKTLPRQRDVGGRSGAALQKQADVSKTLDRHVTAQRHVGAPADTSRHIHTHRHDMREPYSAHAHRHEPEYAKVTKPAKVSEPSRAPPPSKMYESMRGPESVRVYQPTRVSEPSRVPEHMRVSDARHTTEYTRRAEQPRAHQQAKPPQQIRVSDYRHVPEHTKVTQHVRTQEPARVTEPIRTYEPVRRPEPVRTSEPVRTYEPVRKPEPVRTQPVRTQESARVTEPVRTYEPVRRPEPVRTSEQVRSTEPVRTYESVRRPEPVRTSEPIRKQEPFRVPEPVVKQEPARAPEPVRQQEPSIVSQPARAAEPVRKQDAAMAQEPVRVPEPVRAPEPIRLQEPARAPEPAKTVVEDRKTEPQKVSEPTRTPGPTQVPESVMVQEPARPQEPVSAPEPIKAPQPAREIESAKPTEPSRTPEPVKVPEPPRVPEPMDVPDSAQPSEQVKPAEPVHQAKAAPEQIQTQKTAPAHGAPDLQMPAHAHATPDIQYVPETISISDKPKDSTAARQKPKPPPRDSSMVSTFKPPPDDHQYSNMAELQAPGKSDTGPYNQPHPSAEDHALSYHHHGDVSALRGYGTMKPPSSSVQRTSPYHSQAQGPYPMEPGQVPYPPDHYHPAPQQLGYSTLPTRGYKGYPHIEYSTQPPGGPYPMQYPPGDPRHYEGIHTISHHAGYGPFPPGSYESYQQMVGSAQPSSDQLQHYYPGHEHGRPHSAHFPSHAHPPAEYYKGQHPAYPSELPPHDTRPQELLQQHHPQHPQQQQQQQQQQQHWQRETHTLPQSSSFHKHKQFLEEHLNGGSKRLTLKQDKVKPLEEEIPLTEQKMPLKVDVKKEIVKDGEDSKTTTDSTSQEEEALPSIEYKDRDDSQDALLAKDDRSDQSSAGYTTAQGVPLPPHRYRCVKCGCPLFCCVRKAFFVWIFFFISLHIGCLAILGLDGFLSESHGHTFGR